MKPRRWARNPEVVTAVHDDHGHVGSFTGGWVSSVERSPHPSSLRGAACFGSGVCVRPPDVYSVGPRFVFSAVFDSVIAPLPERIVEAERREDPIGVIRFPGICRRRARPAPRRAAARSAGSWPIVGATAGTSGSICTLARGACGAGWCEASYPKDHLRRVLPPFRTVLKRPRGCLPRRPHVMRHPLGSADRHSGGGLPAGFVL